MEELALSAYVIKDGGVRWRAEVTRNAGHDGSDDVIAYLDNGYAAF